MIQTSGTGAQLDERLKVALAIRRQFKISGVAEKPAFAFAWQHVPRAIIP
jgi:hypothetical protein